MAEQRTIRTVLELNASRFTAGAAQAASSARSLATEMDRLGGSGSKLQGDYSTVGTTLLGIGTAAVSGLGLATKAAMDWESAWAGVTKTVDGNAQQMGVLEDQLRGLAKTLPASHEEIAAVAEAAGQLGVKRQDIASFTKTMIDLGQTTNLSADEAATAIAQFSNVMHVSSGDVDNLGATLVDLGNKGASTERDIMEMAQRLSGAGAMIGASSQDILGLSSALADVGISAEAGGGSITRVLQKMNTAVLDGGAKLDGFAKVAGVSADEFAAKWKSSPIEAFSMFEKGVNGVTASGGNAVATLSSLGIKSSEESRAVLSLSSNYQGLEKSLGTANTAWAQNTALVAEASKRYETTESKVRIAGNQIKDAAIDLGGSLLPVLAKAAEGVAGLAEAFGKLPAPVQNAVAGLGLIGGAAALVVGGAMKIIPAISDTIGAFQRLRTESPQLADGVGKVGKALGALTLTAGVVEGLAALGDSMHDYTMGANEAAESTQKVAHAASPMAEVFHGMIDEDDLGSVKDMANGLDVLANGRWWTGIQDKGTEVLSVFGDFGPTISDQRDRLKQFGDSLAGLAETDLPQAQQAFKAMWEQMGGSEDVGENLLKTMPAFRDYLIGVANAAHMATDDATLLKIATGEITPTAQDAQGAVEGMSGAMDGGTQSAEAQSKALDDLNDQIQDVGNAWLGARGSARDYQQAIDDASDALERNGATLDIATKAGRDNQAALDDIASSALDYAHAQFDLNHNVDEANGILSDARQHYVDMAVAMGMPRAEAEQNADAANLMADAYTNVPTEVNTKLTLDTMDADQKIDAYKQKFGEVPPKVLTEAGVDTRMGELHLSDMTKQMDQFSATEVTAKLDVDTEDGRAALADLETAMSEADGSVTINGKTDDAEGALNALIQQINASNGEVTINGQSVPADHALDTVISQINSGQGTVTIKGNNGPASQSVDQVKGKADSTSGTVKVGANTGAAESQIDTAARDRYATIHINAVMTGAATAAAAAARAIGHANGGFIAKGLAAGGFTGNGYGWVNAPYPGKGVDNVLWPLAHGGQVLAQPLAGGEFVMNPIAAAANAGVLEWMNAGGRLSAPTRSTSVTNHFHDVGGVPAQVATERVLTRIARSMKEAV